MVSKDLKRKDTGGLHAWLLLLKDCGIHSG